LKEDKKPVSAKKPKKEVKRTPTVSLLVANMVVCCTDIVKQVNYWTLSLLLSVPAYISVSYSGWKVFSYKLLFK